MEMSEILEKIPVEVKWAMSSGRAVATGLMAQLGAIVGGEKLEEILTGMFGGAGKRVHPFVKEKYNIPVEDAAGAAKLSLVVGGLILGPEYESKIVETTPEKAVRRTTKCPWTERFTEYNIDPEYRVCTIPCAKFVEEGFKAVNPNIAFQLTKSLAQGDPYCEFVYELKK
jgi:hypothetical protein